MAKYFLHDGKLLVLDGEQVTEAMELVSVSIHPMKFAQESDDEEEEIPVKNKKKTRKGKRACPVCGGIGHNSRTCPKNADREPRLERGEALPSDEEANEDDTSKNADIEHRIKQGMSLLEIARECDTTPGTVASIKSRMKRRGDLPEKVAVVDPEDLSDLVDPDEE